MHGSEMHATMQYAPTVGHPPGQIAFLYRYEASNLAMEVIPGLLKFRTPPIMCLFGTQRLLLAQTCG